MQIGGSQFHSIICTEQGLPSAHGLRKAAATRAANDGATAHELVAIFGWIDIKEAEIYTWAADRKRLAARAMGKLETRSVYFPTHYIRSKKPCNINCWFVRWCARRAVPFVVISMTCADG